MPEQNNPITEGAGSYNLNPAANNQTNQGPKPKLPLLQRLLGKSASFAGPVLSEENVFTKLFGKAFSKNETAKPVSVPSPSAALRTSGAEGPAPPPPPSISSLLGPKSAFTRGLYEEAEKKRAQIAKAIFIVGIFIALAVYLFFYTQLNPSFTWFSDQLGPNVAIRFERSNSELQKVQTDFNLLRYRIAHLWLDEVNSKIDAFQQSAAIINSDFSTNSEKQKAFVEFQILGAEIKKALSGVQTIFNQPLGRDTYSVKPVSPDERDKFYENLLTEAIAKQKEAFDRNKAQAREESRAIDNVLRLVENKRFRNMIRSKDLAKISEKDFSAMLSEIREAATDELSLIDKIKRRRLDWAKEIQNIHTVTMKVDDKYGHGLFKTIGGFLFNSYSFDSKTGRISISGFTKTVGSKTFSQIVDLVDSIEKSPYFKDIDFRSFTKSRDESDNYSSSLGLDFSLQTESDSRDETPINPPL